MNAKIDSGITLLNENIWPDPYPTYKQLREYDPVHWVPELNGWFVSKHKDISRILTDQEHFSKENISLLEASLDPTVLELNRLLFVDDPEHANWRSLFQGFFSPGKVGRFEEIVTEIVDNEIAALRDKSELDLLKGFAYRIPINVLCHILGLPKEDYDKFAAWAPHLNEAFSPIPTPEQKARGTQAYSEVKDYLKVLLEEKMSATEQTDDILSIVATACAQGKISELDAIGLAVIFYVGGHETTLNFIAKTLYQLLRNPTELAKVRRNRDLLAKALNETARYDNIAHFWVRRVKKSTSIDGVALKEDDLILLGLASGNRDPDCCENPDKFIVDRPNNVRSLAFSGGPHFCIGAHLARLEAKIAISKLIDAFPEMSLATSDPLPTNCNFFMNGLIRLPVRLNT